MKKEVEFLESLSTLERPSEYQNGDAYSEVLKASEGISRVGVLIAKSVAGISDKFPGEQKEEIINDLNELIKLVREQSRHFQEYDEAMARYNG